MKVTIPEPVAWLWKWKDLPDAGWQCSMVGGWRDTSAIMTQSLITTDQAEAYSQAVRREALEEAAALCDRFAAREMHPAECAGAIRAMIPQEQS